MSGARSDGPGLAVGVDIGGTKVAAGLVDDAGRIVARARRATPARWVPAGAVEDVIVGVVEELRASASRPVVAVGIGAAGFVDADAGTVAFAPHLSWRQEPLRDALADRLGLAVALDNDANAAAWAEGRFGAARGETHALMVTLGTGIGGAILTRGALERGRFGLAGEFGHAQVVPDGAACECGQLGCWEQYASGTALMRRARALVESGSAAGAGLAARAAADPGGLTGPLITDAARAGDAGARSLLAEVGHWLGVGIAGLVAAFDPGVVVVGGGLGAAGEFVLGPARESFLRRLPGRGHRPECRLLAAELGPDAGLVGAADLARAAAQAAAEPPP